MSGMLFAILQLLVGLAVGAVALVAAVSYFTARY